jgi:phosphoglycerate dehydrogenase-like enzyme
MKVVAYSIKSFEKEFLAKANQKKHDITLISNSLSLETAIYAEGKDAVIVFTNDDVSELVINKLAELGIKYIATRSAETDHIDKTAALNKGIKLAHVLISSYPEFLTDEVLQQIADQTIQNLDNWQQSKCVGKACVCAKSCRAMEVMTKTDID